MRIIRRHAIIDLLKLPLAGALLAPLAACSVHPIPDDVTRIPTIEIVRNIRCEALAGIDSLRPDELARAEPIIKASVIGYDFTFEMTEKNNLDSAEVTNPFLVLKNGSKFNAGVDGGTFLERANTRSFLVIEALNDLRSKESRARCASGLARRKRLHPIAGSIGMDEVVRTYLRVEMLSELQSEQSFHVDQGTKFTATGKQIVFADDITFTTTLSAGVGGSIQLNAVSGQLNVSNVALSARASRKDVHRVIVALTRKEVDVVERRLLRSLSRGGRRSHEFINRQELLAEDKIPDPRAQALLIQVDEEARTQVAMELYRRRSLYDPDNLPAEALGQRFLDLLKIP